MWGEKNGGGGGGVPVSSQYVHSLESYSSPILRNKLTIEEQWGLTPNNCLTYPHRKFDPLVSVLYPGQQDMIHHGNLHCLGTSVCIRFRDKDACLEGQLETVECFTSHANTDIAAAVLHQEGQVRLTDMIGNHDEVTFVLPVSIVEYNHEFARLQVLNSLCGRCRMV